MDAKVVNDVEEEMMDRFQKMPMRDLLKLTDTMTEDDFEKDDDDEELEQKLQVRAKRSLSAVAGAIGLGALYKKFLSSQDECRQVEVPHCAEVPIETCYDVRSCQVQRSNNARCKAPSHDEDFEIKLKGYKVLHDVSLPYPYYVTPL